MNMKNLPHIIRALFHSLQGLKTCFCEEIAFRQECLLALPYFAAIIVLPLPFGCRLYLTALWFFLIALELLNTAIEAVVNLVSPEWHVLAKKAKDCASAAVFCILTLIMVSWVMVLLSLSKNYE